jgi:hypothetical protein
MNGLLDAVAMTAIVSMLVGLFAPFVEGVAIFADTPENKQRHDAALRLLNLALQIATVVLSVAAVRSLTLADVLPLLAQALAQAAGAHVGFRVVTRSSASDSKSDSNGIGGPPVDDIPPGFVSPASVGLPTRDGEAAQQAV